MPRPGVDITISDPTAVGGAVLDTGQAFLLGQAQRGPIDSPVRLRNLRDYERACGPRSGGQVAHDSVRAYFSERGSVVHFLRLSGTNAKHSEAEVGPLNVSAASPGTWGNAVTVALEAEGSLAASAYAQLRKAAGKGKRKPQARDDNDNGNGEDGEVELPVRVTVAEDGKVVERSAPVTTAEQAVAWARRSDFVRLAADDPAAELSKLAAVALTGGTDDRTITPAVVADTLERFEYSLGPGQVAYPGAVDFASHVAVLEHVERNRRVALLDLRDDDEVTMAADVMQLWTVTGSRFAAALAPRLEYPGPAPRTNVLVPYSAVQAGIIARQDQITGNPNESAAGVNGTSLNARGLAHEYTDDSREQLNELGVTLAKRRFGVVRTYGSRTCAGPEEPNWRWFPGSRVVMAIAFEADAAAEDFVHRQIDGQRHLIAALEVVLGGICLRYFVLGALFGDTAEEAFRVNTDAVNTPETIEAGELHAVISLKSAPPGEWVQIDISKRPINAPV